MVNVFYRFSSTLCPNKHGLIVLCLVYNPRPYGNITSFAVTIRLCYLFNKVAFSCVYTIIQPKSNSVTQHGTLKHKMSIKS